MNEKNTIRITKRPLVQEIAESTGYRDSMVTKVIDSLSDVITKYLVQATPNKDVSINICGGIFVDSKYELEKETVNCLTGKKITVPNRIKVKARRTLSYQEKINRLANET